jgi:hypothetical protein
MPSMAGPKGRGFRGGNAKDEQSPRHQKKQPPSGGFTSAQFISTLTEPEQSE